MPYICFRYVVKSKTVVAIPGSRVEGAIVIDTSFCNVSRLTQRKLIRLMLINPHPPISHTNNWGMTWDGYSLVETVSKEIVVSYYESMGK